MTAPKLDSASYADGTWGNAWPECRTVTDLDGREVLILTIIGYAPDDHTGTTDSAHMERWATDSGVNVLDRIRALTAEADRLDGGSM